VRILLDNVNTNSSSGPNSFAKLLVNELQKKGHVIDQTIKDPDVQLSFIMTKQKQAKMVLRLDGIYFNTCQSWDQLNNPIRQSYKIADLVIHQSKFNSELTETFFGFAKKSIIINNGTCFESISNIAPIDNTVLNNFSEVWSCASSWRPHKRLKDNINYFLENAPADACMIVAGENVDYNIAHPRILYAGQLSWSQCIAVYKKSTTFVHLAFLDHCPNVVVDASASGCKLVVASSGGTKEIAGINATIVKDLDWDMKPLDLYAPPKLDYSNVAKSNIDCNINIVDVSDRYITAMESI